MATSQLLSEPDPFLLSAWRLANERRMVRAPISRLTTTMQKPFPHAGFLRELELLVESTSGTAHKSVPPALAPILLASDGSGSATPAAVHLIQLLKARKAMLQAALDTELAADELRRYQKFSKPGPPSPHIVFLRQKQAAARHASNQSKQSFIKAAATFVRDAGIKFSPRVSLEVFAIKWIDANVPVDLSQLF